MKNRLLYFWVSVVASLLVVFVSSQGQEKPQPTLEEEVLSPPRETPLEESIHALVHGNSTFAFNLYNQLRKSQGNLFFSPYCISTAFAIPFMGARAGTFNQMQTTLHYLPHEENLDRAFSELNRRFTKSWMQGPNEVRLMMANGLFVQRNFQLESEFLDRVKRSFGLSLKQVDFLQNPEAARLNINDWVREKTQGRIPNMVEQGNLSSDTRLVVVSSIFLKAVWQFPFDANLTAQVPFFIDPATTISVPMMHLSKRLNVFQHPQFTLLELPYSMNPTMSQSQFDMLLLLPTTVGGISQLETLLASGDLDEWMKSMQPEQVIVSLPRFKFTMELDLGETLKQMGMPVVFSELADFTGIFGGGGLFINKALHKAYISLDEKGTEAVAATAISINMTSVLQEKPPLVFKADHPFIFVIVDRSTETILFMGRFSVPANQ
jgi:serpin B